MSASGKRHMQRVADWGTDNGCVVCGGQFAHVHHMLADRVPGRKADDWLTMPLCLDCHTGLDGIHGTRIRWRLHKVSESQALATTLGALYGR